MGDVYQTKSYSPNSGNPPGYTTYTIIGKSYSVNNDTIFYVMKRNIFVPFTSNTTDTIFTNVTDLSGFAIHNNQTTCMALQDTMYLDSCNRQVWAKFPITDTACFEPIWHSTIVIEGLGGAYGSYYDPTTGPITWGEYTLEYYLKYPDSCGTLVVAVSETGHAKWSLHVYPNPATSYLTIEHIGITKAQQHSTTPSGGW